MRNGGRESIPAHWNDHRLSERALRPRHRHGRCRLCRGRAGRQHHQYPQRRNNARCPESHRPVTRWPAPGRLATTARLHPRLRTDLSRVPRRVGNVPGIEGEAEGDAEDTGRSRGPSVDHLPEQAVHADDVGGVDVDVDVDATADEVYVLLHLRKLAGEKGGTPMSSPDVALTIRWSTPTITRSPAGTRSGPLKNMCLRLAAQSHLPVNPSARAHVLAPPRLAGFRLAG